MKNVSSLFVIVVFALILSACGPMKTEENVTSNLQVNNNSVEYDLDMYLNRPNPIAIVDLNFVTVSAPVGTELGYRENMGKVNPTGVGTNFLTLTLVSGPADVDVFVTKCPDGNCPAKKVHFEHIHLYP